MLEAHSGQPLTATRSEDLGAIVNDALRDPHVRDSQCRRELIRPTSCSPDHVARIGRILINCFGIIAKTTASSSRCNPGYRDVFLSICWR